MRMLFIIPGFKSQSGRKSLTVSPHLGIAYLSAYLKIRGIEVKIYDDGIDKNQKKLLNLIKEFKPNLIGITVFSYCYNYARDLIKTLKLNFNYPLVMGGPHINVTKAQVLIDTDAEFAIKQEGEESLLELLKEIENGNGYFGKIAGLIWKNRNGKIIENSDRPYIKNLDSLPFPDYESFSIDQYFCHTDRTLPPFF